MRFFVVVLVAVLAGCASTKNQKSPSPGPVRPIPQTESEVPHEPLAEKGNHSPYRVLGKTYHVLPSSRGYVEQGFASWYGDQFHGRPTSSMEPFNMHELTAAHKTLPLPTYARVTNLENGQSVVVRVNDRGPFKDDRIIDLSFAAADALDMVNQGVAMVEVVAIVPESADFDRPLVETAEQLYLQLGAFGSRENALMLVRNLRDAGVVGSQVVSDASVHRVRIGPLPSAEKADSLTAELVIGGFERPVVIYE